MIECPLTTVIPLSIMYVLATGVSIVGNCLLFCIIFNSTKARRKFYSNFLVLLSVSDTLAVLFHSVSFFERLLRKLTPGYDTSFFRNNAICIIEEFLKYSCYFVSAFGTVLFTLERFMSVYWPVRGRLLCRGKQSLVAIACLLLVTVVIQSFRLVSTEASYHRCIIKKGIIRSYFSAIELLGSLVGYILPALIILITNMLILLQILQVTRQQQYPKTACTPTIPGLRHRYHLQQQQNPPQSQLSPQKQLTAADTDTLLPTNSSGLPSGDTGSTTAATTTTSAAANTSTKWPTRTAAAEPLCQPCHLQTDFIKQYHLKIKRTTTTIMLLISFTYIIFHSLNAGISIFFSLKFRAVFNNHSKANRAEMKIHLERHFCFIQDIASLFSVLGYGSNFYIYFMFGQNFKNECTKLRFKFCQFCRRHLFCLLCSPHRSRNHNHSDNNSDFPLGLVEGARRRPCDCFQHSKFNRANFRHHEYHQQELLLAHKHPHLFNRYPPIYCASFSQSRYVHCISDSKRFFITY